MRGFLRLLAFLLAQFMMQGALSAMIGGAVAAMPTDGPSGNPSAGFSVIATGIFFAAFATWLSITMYRIGGALATIFWATLFALTGLVMLPVAAALAQFEPSGPARERAGILLLAAAAALLTAAVLGWLGWRWTASGSARGILRQALRGTAIGWGAILCLLAVLLIAGAVAAAGEVRSDPDQVSVLAVAAGNAAVYLVAGLLLLYHGVSAYMHTGSTRLRITNPFIWLAAWLLVVAVGWVLIDEQRWLAVGFPFIHIAAAFLPGIILITLVLVPSRAAAAEIRPSWRTLGLAWAWGAACATTIAVVLNSVSAGGIAIAVLAQAEAFEGMRNAEDFSDVLENADFILSTRQAFVGALLLLSVSTPLIEEPSKAFGVRLLRRSPRFSYAGFVAGVASGVAFGTLEAVTYGASALEQAPQEWWTLMLLRGGATSMHAVATGLFGLGIAWAAARAWSRSALAVLGAMLMHGGWNGLATAASSDALPIINELSEHTLELALMLVLGAWSIGNVVALFLIARRLARIDSPPLPVAPEADTDLTIRTTPILATLPQVDERPAPLEQPGVWQRPAAPPPAPAED